MGYHPFVRTDGGVEFPPLPVPSGQRLSPCTVWESMEGALGEKARREHTGYPHNRVD